jgi:uncharacterized protein YndB with AHSA1/START domain
MLAASRDSVTMILPSDREIVLTRVFGAPRRLVFEAWTRPEHVRRWYGCGQLQLVACDIDLRAGGAWRYTLRAPDGAQLTVQGVYREVVPPGRLVHTEQTSRPGFTSSEALVTVLFAEHAGMTILTGTIVCRTIEDRDARLESGMERGVAEALDRLAAHLMTMA